MKKIVIIVLALNLGALMAQASIGSLGMAPAVSKGFRDGMDHNCSNWGIGTGVACFGDWVLGEHDEEIKIAFNYVSKDSPLMNEGITNASGVTARIQSEGIRVAYNSLLECGLFSVLTKSAISNLANADLSDRDAVAQALTKALKDQVPGNLTFPEQEALTVFLFLTFGYTFYV